MWTELQDLAASVPVAPWPTPGTRSSDDVAIVGHDGWAFILKGSNNYYDAYLPAASDGPLAQAWQDHVEQTRHILSAEALDFAFAVVPNKATLLPDRYPLPTGGGPTGRMALLNARLSTRDRQVFDRFMTDGRKESLFRRNDSHLTEYGNLLLADAIIGLTGVPTDWSHYDLTTVSAHVHAGDLGRRFSPPLQETYFRLHHPVADVTVTPHDHPARKGAFQGLSYSTSNPGAPIDRSILIFGNSFIERFPSWSASMPLVATLRHLHFVWLPSVDLDLARRLRPDLVLFQTCERFLERAPQALALQSTSPARSAQPQAAPVSEKEKRMKLSRQSYFRLDATLPEAADVLCGKTLVTQVPAGTVNFPLHTLISRIPSVRKQGLRLRGAGSGKDLGALDATDFLDAYFGPDKLAARMQKAVKPGKWVLYSYQARDGVVTLKVGLVLPVSVPADVRFTVTCNGVPEKTRSTTYDAHLGSGHWFMPASHVLALECTFDIARIPDWCRVQLVFDAPHDDLNVHFRPNFNLTRLAMLEGLPDEARIKRVASANANAVSFFNGGKTAFERIADIAAARGVDFRSGGRQVLDWGVDCGRVVLHANRQTDAQVTGIDIDADNIGWCRENLRGDFQLVGLEPPTTLPDNRFDLIWSCSVLSHLTETTASAWLAEMARVLAPGGLALLSFNGLSNTVSYLSRRPEDLRPVLEGKLFDRDINNELKGFIPSDTYYRQVFGNDAWWHEMFSRHFRVDGYEYCVVSGFQHLAVLRKI